MVITLYTEELVNRIRSISHREVAEIADVDARYRAEAGSEKMEEIYHCVDDAAGRLKARCFRFLKSEYTKRRDNVLDVPESYVFEFVLSERRAIGKADALLEAMYTFMAEYALSKFYSIVSVGELSNKHSLLALEAGNMIDSLLYVKQPPRV